MVGPEVPAQFCYFNVLQLLTGHKLTSRSITVFSAYANRTLLHVASTARASS